MRLIEKVWFEGHAAKWLLVPLLFPFSCLFFLLSFLRCFAYRLGVLKTVKLTKPVIVVGNIGVGGNGKTPVVIALVEYCQQLGLKPGVISRGYGGSAPFYPYPLTKKSTASEAGDEPILIYQRFNHVVPVVVGADRIASSEQLINNGCDIIIADDGLQHYRLARDLEIIVVDGKRQFGNGVLLPAGPLREGPWRLMQQYSDNSIVVCNGEIQRPSHYLNAALKMQLQASVIVNLKSKSKLTVENFLGLHPVVQALAGIGDPQRFFNTLINNGFTLQLSKGFVDHHQFTALDLNAFDVSIPLLMTEKDAVKCQHFVSENCWYLAVDAKFSEQDQQMMIDNIKQLI